MSRKVGKALKAVRTYFLNGWLELGDSGYNAAQVEFVWNAPVGGEAFLARRLQVVAHFVNEQFVVAFDTLDAAVPGIQMIHDVP